MATMSERKQEIHLFIDKLRGLMKFVAKPRPPLPGYSETVTLFAEQVTEQSRPLIGQLMTPVHLAVTVNIAKRAIYYAKSRTGMELEFHQHLVGPQEFDDAESSDISQRTIMSVEQAMAAQESYAKLLAQMEKSTFPEYVLDTVSGKTTVVVPEDDRKELIGLLEEVADVSGCEIGQDLQERIEAKIGRKGRMW